MEEVVIKNIATGEETVVSQVVVKAPVPAQTIAMDEDPSKNDLVGNKPPFNHQSPFAHPSRPNSLERILLITHRIICDQKLISIHIRMICKKRSILWRNDQSDVEQSEGRGITIEELLSAMGTDVKFDSYQCTMNYLVDHLNSHQNNCVRCQLLENWMVKMNILKGLRRLKAYSAYNKKRKEITPSSYKTLKG